MNYEPAGGSYDSARSLYCTLFTPRAAAEWKHRCLFLVKQQSAEHALAGDQISCDMMMKLHGFNGHWHFGLILFTCFEFTAACVERQLQFIHSLCSGGKLIDSTMSKITVKWILRDVIPQIMHIVEKRCALHRRKITSWVIKKIVQACIFVLGSY